MAKIKRKNGETTLSGRNAVETINDLLRIINTSLPQSSKLSTVSTPKDLFDLRKKINELSLPKDVSSVTRDTAVKKYEEVSKPIEHALSIIATNAWRARNKMVDADNGETKEEMKRVYRHIEAQFDALSQIGIEVRDLRGRTYDAGMALKVISFEPQPGLSKDEIIETIKPTVTWNGQLIQMGEVIVGTPLSK